jgi:predicted MFS family arabinose efflux permease
MSETDATTPPYGAAASGSPTAPLQHRRLLWVLSTATFLIFFQAFMIAPLIPRLAEELGASTRLTGLIVPAYMIPYGIATLVYGLASDRLGRRRLMLVSLAAFVVLTAATATAQSVEQLIAWRLATGLGASGVVPLALVLIGQLYPFEQRGRPLGWLFAAMAGGMAFGSSLGALAQPFIGWRGLFLAVAALSALVIVALAPHTRTLGERPPHHTNLTGLLAGYRRLFISSRGRRTYSYVLLNSIFHSGVYTWIGLYFVQRYGLGEVGIALAILGYGVPGFLFGTTIGKAADRWGRRLILPAGLAVGALGAAALIPTTTVVLGAFAVLVLSLGYDLTQPLFAGIVTALGGKRPGQAMGLNVFLLFTGLGLGSFVFGELLRADLSTALLVFAVGEVALAVLAIPLFRAERPAPQLLTDRPAPGQTAERAQQR